jgi:hypothetical protein
VIRFIDVFESNEFHGKLSAELRFIGHTANCNESEPPGSSRRFGWNNQPDDAPG